MDRQAVQSSLHDSHLASNQMTSDSINRLIAQHGGLELPANTISLLRGAEKALVCVDPTDVDNIELAIAVISHFGIENTCILLTGRCAIHPDEVKRRVSEADEQGVAPTQAIPIEEWDSEFSQQLLQASALRFQKALELFGYDKKALIVDGGLAKAPRVPHTKHMDDLFGFEDVSREEFRQIENGEKVFLKNRDAIQDFIGNKNFVAFVGGPATGLDIALEECPDLKQKWVGLFGQLGSLGSVKGMEIEGRTEDAQFNVLLDPTSGKSLLQKAEQGEVPSFLLPSDVTRSPHIGFGDSRMMDFILKSDDPGMLHLANLRSTWEQHAIRTQKGEVLRTHDLATMFMYLQLIDECDPIFDLKPVQSAKVITRGKREGVIDFTLGGQANNLFISTELRDPRAYLTTMRNTLTAGRIAKPQQVFLSTSLSESDQNNHMIKLDYEGRIARKIGPLLREGAVIHFGCHPAAIRIMNDYAKQFPDQIVAHLLTKYEKETRPLLNHIPDQNIRLHDSNQQDALDQMITQMVARANVGVFVGGRRDVETTESKESEMLYEFLALQWGNPDAHFEIDDDFDGIASDLELVSNLKILAKMVGNKKRMARILSLLDEMEE